MNPNEPAFPVAIEIGPKLHYSNEGSTREIKSSLGMSLRAYFAGQALPSVIRVLSDIQPETLERKQFTPEDVGKCCATYADAVISELNKETKP